MDDLLDFPDFLRRDATIVATRLRRSVRSKKRRDMEHTRPEGETWTAAVLVDVLLYDEAQPIGCGRRLVWAREGRKWCKLAALDGSKAKITMAVWATIARRTL